MDHNSRSGGERPRSGFQAKQYRKGRGVGGEVEQEKDSKEVRKSSGGGEHASKRKGGDWMPRAM